MGIKEFSQKTFVFIILPGLLFYGVRNCRASEDQQHSSFRGCVRRLQQTPPLALIIYSDSGGRRITDPIALGQLPIRTAALHWVFIPIAEHRYPRREYRVTVVAKNQPEQDIYPAQTTSGREVVAWSGDSLFLDEKRKLFPFIDSLYQHASPDPPTEINLRWLSLDLR